MYLKGSNVSRTMGHMSWISLPWVEGTSWVFFTMKSMDHDGGPFARLKRRSLFCLLFFITNVIKDTQKAHDRTDLQSRRMPSSSIRRATLLNSGLFKETFRLRTLYPFHHLCHHQDHLYLSLFLCPKLDHLFHVPFLGSYPEV